MWCMYMCVSVPDSVSISKWGLCYKFSEKLSCTAILYFHFHKACIRIKGHLKLLRNKQLMPFCQAGANQGNLNHMLYSVTSLKCQP